MLEAVAEVGTRGHPKTQPAVIAYGTAGFRTKGSNLDHVIFRMGALAVLRSKYKSATIGAMITASHNPEEDNGIKLVDPMGEMLEMAWEKLATELANVPNEELGQVLGKIIQDFNIDISIPAKVVYGRDTRPSSPSLAQAFKDGVEAANGMATDIGIVSTPQLHYVVRCINTEGQYGDPTEQGYYEKLGFAFKCLRGEEAEKGRYKPELTIDGANGVGAIKMKQFQPLLGQLLNIKVVNDGSTGKLNYQCGADFVKTNQKAPNGLDLQPGLRCASFDGDADRIVYYCQDESGKFQLMDGDKIATLVAGYLKELVAGSDIDLNLGLIQTAYANGSSTEYIEKSLKVPVACVPTGVKHLHHKAGDFDIGVYFEANGHGTVLFSQGALNKIEEAATNEDSSPEKRGAAARLAATVDLINQTVGDAISDLLLVETVLHARGWNIDDWNKAYKDLPNRLLKVKVADRTVISTTDAERKTTAPVGLQEELDKIVARYNKGRSFVRPSGTEDVVRVYAESDTQENTDRLAYEVSVAVYKLAGGVGEEPKPF